MITVPAIVVVPLVLAPFALLVWLALRWPGEAAEDALWRLGDDAWDAGDRDAAARYRRVASSFGVCRDRVRPYELSALVAFRPLRARTEARQPDEVDRAVARVWARASVGLIVWSAGVAAGCAARSPSLVFSPTRWAQITLDRLTRVFCAHDAAVAEAGDRLAVLAANLN